MLGNAALNATLGDNGNLDRVSVSSAMKMYTMANLRVLHALIATATGFCLRFNHGIKSFSARRSSSRVDLH